MPNSEYQAQKEEFKKLYGEKWDILKKCLKTK